MASSTGVLDAEASSLSSQKPRYPGRPTRAPSVESLHFAALANSSSGAGMHPNVLKKRHSTYTLSNASSASSLVGIDRTASLPPLPDMPPTAPLRPPRNPARPVSHTPPPPQRKKSRSRPSTADNGKDRAEVTPWEFQSLKEEEAEAETPPFHSKAKSLSVRSRSSSTGLGKQTGPVEVVTPWEVQSLEEELVEIEKVYDSTPRSHAPTSGAPIATSTGPVEDVTPWELHPLPVTQSQRGPSASSNSTGRVGRSSTSLHTHPNLSSSNISHNSPASQPIQISSLSNPSTPLTNVFGNTSLPPNGGRSHSNSTSSTGSFTGSNQHANLTSQPPRTPYQRSTYSSSFGHTGTGPVEDVTPWELHPVPDESSSPNPSRSATSSNFTPARRSMSRPSSAKGQASPSRPSSAKGLYSGTSFLTGIDRGVHTSPSGGVSSASKSSSSQSLTSVGPGVLGKLNSHGAGTGGKVGATGRSSGPPSSTGMLGLGSEGTGVEPAPIPLSSAPPSSPGPSHAALRGSESVGSHNPPIVNGPPLGSKQSHPQLQHITRPPPTGPTEDVTPWELHPATLPLPDAGVSSRFLLKAPSQDKVRTAGEARRSRPTSKEDAKFEREDIQRDQAADNAINLEDDLDARIQAEQVSGTTKDDKPTQGRPRPSMTLDQLEEVMPWELYPPPPSPVVALSTSESGVAAGKRRAPTETYGPGHKTLSDFGLRRRRSTGASGATSASSGGYSSGGGPSTTRRESRLKDREDRERGDKIRTSTSTGLGGASIATSPLATSPLSPLGSTSSVSASSSQLASPPSSQSTSLSTTPQPPKFSTVDRTILEQLKASLQAREAQFTLKGVGHTIVGGGRSPGKKHHTYSKEVVPYPRSYGREVVDLDVWETMFALDICESLTWHVFETPPTKVLEIGCGTGTWILRCAETWKECHFVGLDVVPLHPDLQNVGSESASRITWLQHNFLDGLPFQNEEFDFVHIKRIALGVPENKWDKLFEDIERVMKPGGAFEMVEEDLFFPGKPADDGDDPTSPMRCDDSSSVTRRNSTSSDNSHGDLNGDADTRSETPTTITHQAHVNGREYGSRNDHDEDHRPLLPKPSANSSQPPHALVPTHAAPPSTPAQSVPFILPHSRSTSRPALSVKTHRNGDPNNFIGFAAHPSMFGSSVSLLGSMGYIALNDPFSDMVKKVQQQQQRERATSQTSASSPQKTTSSPFTLRGLTNSPTNPRDHTILEAVWNGMLESRFVNLTPLSILTTVLEYHFKDVRTHPPLLYTFPPVPIKPEEEEEEDGVDGDQHLLPSDSEPDTDDARDAVIPRPKRPRSTKSKKSSGSNSSAPAPFSDENGEFSENHRWLSMQALLRNQSPYVTLDESRTFGYSPSRKAAFPVKVIKEGSNPGLRRMSRLPNTTLNIDLRTLNLHLALRAKEVIACSESMWEWVLEYQADALTQRDGRNRSASVGSYMMGVDVSASSSSLDLTKNVILEMTRDDFDLLLNNFEMDMQDKASVGNALRERFDWHVFTSPILQDRKAFENACEKYDGWAATQKAKPPTNPYRHSNTHRTKSSMSTPGFVLPVPDSSTSHSHNQISRSTSNPQPSSTSHHPDDASSLTVTETPPSTKSHHHHDSGSTVHFAVPLPSPSTASQMSHAMPTQMLSRAMRVFVAWKAL